MPPIYGCPEIFRESLATPTATFHEIVNGLLLQSIVLKCVQNLKFVALPVPEIKGGTQKIWAVPGYARTPFSPKFVRLLFRWTLRMYWPNLKSVAFPIPQIIGCTQKISAVPEYAHAPFSPKLLMGFCSDGPCKCTGQV